jgi:ADYC domain
MKLLGVVLVLLLGCGSKKTEPGPGPGTGSVGSGSAGSGSGSGSILPKCTTPPEPACNIAMCGGNSAVINAFPINGLREDGECSPEGAQLVPGSMAGPHCAGATLSMENKKLVGRNADGTIKCKNEKLVGATFLMRTEFEEEMLKIFDVVDYAYDPNDATKTVTAYRIIWTKEDEDDITGRKKGLCTSKQGRKLRKKLKMKYVKYTDVPDLPDPSKELVIPVRSELYDAEGNFVPVNPVWKLQQKEWLNLACVDDALAKRTLHHQMSANDIENRAVLRMWTADYCGGLPFTMRGKGINWSKKPNLEIEAQWDDKGATCLTAPRLLRTDQGQPVVPTDMTKRLKQLCPPATAPTTNCTTLAGWMTTATTCLKSDGTLDRVLPACTPCTGPNCPLESRIPKNPIP